MSDHSQQFDSFGNERGCFSNLVVRACIALPEGSSLRRCWTGCIGSPMMFTTCKNAMVQQKKLLLGYRFPLHPLGFDIKAAD